MRAEDPKSKGVWASGGRPRFHWVGRAPEVSWSDVAVDTSMIVSGEESEGVMEREVCSARRGWPIETCLTMRLSCWTPPGCAFRFPFFFKKKRRRTAAARLCTMVSLPSSHPETSPGNLARRPGAQPNRALWVGGGWAEWCLYYRCTYSLLAPHAATLSSIDRPLVGVCLAAAAGPPGRPSSVHHKAPGTEKNWAEEWTRLCGLPGHVRRQMPHQTAQQVR